MAQLAPSSATRAERRLTLVRLAVVAFLVAPPALGRPKDLDRSLDRAWGLPGGGAE